MQTIQIKKKNESCKWPTWVLIVSPFDEKRKIDLILSYRFYSSSSFQLKIAWEKSRSACKLRIQLQTVPFKQNARPKKQFIALTQWMKTKKNTLNTHNGKKDVNTQATCLSTEYLMMLCFDDFLILLMVHSSFETPEIRLQTGYSNAAQPMTTT